MQWKKPEAEKISQCPSVQYSLHSYISAVKEIYMHCSLWSKAHFIWLEYICRIGYAILQRWTFGFNHLWSSFLNAKKINSSFAQKIKKDRLWCLLGKKGFFLEHFSLMKQTLYWLKSHIPMVWVVCLSDCWRKVLYIKYFPHKLTFMSDSDAVVDAAEWICGHVIPTWHLEGGIFQQIHIGGTL